MASDRNKDAAADMRRKHALQEAKECLALIRKAKGPLGAAQMHAESSRAALGLPAQHRGQVANARKARSELGTANRLLGSMWLRVREAEEAAREAVSYLDEIATTTTAR